MSVHRHTWERVEFLRPLLAFTCRCGAAYSDIGGQVHYSPRRLVNNQYVWKLIAAAKDGERMGAMLREAEASLGGPRP